jgi:hypothetical protein
MRMRPVLLWVLAWLALFVGLTWLLSSVFVIRTIGIADTFVGDGEPVQVVYDVWWGRTLQWAAGIASAFVAGGLGLMIWFRRRYG